MENMKKITKESYKVITRRPNGSIRVATINKDPSKTDQSMIPDSDINEIMSKFAKNNTITHYSTKQGIYTDVSNIPDLIGASQIVRSAHEKFEALDSKIRLRFQNDPAQLIRFLKDPHNAEEAVRLGLLTKIKNDEPNDEKKQVKSKNKTPPSDKTDPE